jgi:phage-related tail protein
MASKDVVQAVQAQLGNAEDNLARARMQFGRMTSRELAQPYGQSGETCSAVLAGYEREVERWRKALAEVQ